MRKSREQIAENRQRIAEIKSREQIEKEMREQRESRDERDSRASRERAERAGEMQDSSQETFPF